MNLLTPVHGDIRKRLTPVLHRCPWIARRPRLWIAKRPRLWIARRLQSGPSITAVTGTSLPGFCHVGFCVASHLCPQLESP